MTILSIADCCPLSELLHELQNPSRSYHETIRAMVVVGRCMKIHCEIRLWAICLLRGIAVQFVKKSSSKNCALQHLQIICHRETKCGDHWNEMLYCISITSSQKYLLSRQDGNALVTLQEVTGNCPWLPCVLATFSFPKKIVLWSRNTANSFG